MLTILALATEPRHVLPLPVAEERRLAGPRVLSHPIGAAGSRYRAAHPAVGEDELEERLRPGLDAEFLQGFELASGGRVADETPAAQRDHHDHAEPQLLSERQQFSGRRCFGGVVGDLHEAYPAAPHDAHEIRERRARVVRRTDGADPSLVFEAVEHLQPSLDGDEVVDLVELDAAAE